MNQQDFQNLIVSWNDPDRFLDHVWVEDLEHFGMTKFRRWPASVDLWETYLNNRFVVVLKPRQMGGSWAFASIYCWRMVTRPMSRTLIISKGDKEAKEFLSHVRFIWTNLLNGTEFEKAPPASWRLWPDSSEEIGMVWDKDRDIKSEVIALPCTGTAGTSYTATDVFCDEWDKWRSANGSMSIQEQSYSALKPPIDRTKGHFCGCSTADVMEPDSFFKHIWHGAKSGDNPFVPRFYDVTYHPLYTPQWFEDICKEYAGKDYLRRQDYPVTEDEALTPPSEERIFTVDHLREEARSATWIQEKPWVHIRYRFVSGWRYVAGADVASGHGSDYSVLSIIGSNGLSSEVVAVIRSKTLVPNDFAREIYQLCEQYNFPLLAVERNSIGSPLLDNLVAMRYPRLYYKDERAKKDGKPGVITGQSARQRGPNDTGETWIWKLAEDINSGRLKTTFPPQVEELADFFWIDNKAQARGHDDTVMSLAIANTLNGKRSGGMAVIKRKTERSTPLIQRT